MGQNIPRDCVIISDCIKIDIFESLGSSGTGLRIVIRVEGLKIDVICATDSKFDSNVWRKVKIGV